MCDTMDYMGLFRKHSYPRGLRARVRRLEDQMAASQEDIDNLATAVNDLDQKLKAGISTVQTEIDSLEQQINAGGSTSDLNLDSLKSAVAELGSDVEGVQDLKPTGEVAPGAAGAAPTNAQGEAVENTTDPQQASGG